MRRPRLPPGMWPLHVMAFLGALRGGAGVKEAARMAQCALAPLYRRRARDAELDRAWADAILRSDAPVLRPSRRAGGRPRAGKTRRVRFDARRRAEFLELLPLTCCSVDAARGAGVDYCTVSRRMRRDPVFAGLVEAALQDGYARFERQLAREREEAQARLRAGVPRFVYEPVPMPEMDFDRIMTLLKRYERPAPPARRAGPERRALKGWEMIEEINRRLLLRFGPQSG